MGKCPGWARHRVYPGVSLVPEYRKDSVKLAPMRVRFPELRAVASRFGDFDISPVSPKVAGTPEVTVEDRYDPVTRTYDELRAAFERAASAVAAH